MNVNNVCQKFNNAREFIVVTLPAIVSKTHATAKPILNTQFVCNFLFVSAGFYFIAMKYPLLLSALPLVAIAIVSGIIFGMGCMAINACLEPKIKPYDAINDRLKDWNDQTEFPNNHHRWDDNWGDRFQLELLDYAMGCCDYPLLALYLVYEHKYTDKIVFKAINFADKNRISLTPNEVIKVLESKDFKATQDL